jgi:hypothetical protein
VTASETLTDSDQVVLCDASGAVTLTLPAASTGRMIMIKRITAGVADTCAVVGIWPADVTGGTLQLAAPANGGANENAITVISDGTNWYLFSSR